MGEPYRLCIAANVKNLAAIRRFVSDAATTGDSEPEAIADMLLAMNEAATNIIEHGYQGQPGILEIEVEYDGDALVVRLRDHAPAFDPAQVPAPNLALPLEQRPLGGMGIHMMRQLTDEMQYRTVSDGGNELVLVKKGARQSGRGT